MVFAQIDSFNAIAHWVIASLIERQRKDLLDAQVLGVFGTWQREGEVM
jgi:hypothetical protein